MKAVARLIIGFVAISAVSAASAIVVRRRFPEFGDAEDASFRLVAAMDGREFESTSDDFESGVAIAYMGGIELDLSGASIESGAHLQVTAVMGGINITVPRNWRVEVDTHELMGGLLNGTDPDDPLDGPLLLVTATTVMGGIQIIDEPRRKGV